MLITFLSVLLQVATPPTFTPKYDLYPIGATIDEVRNRKTYKAPAKSQIYYQDGEWYSLSGEWNEQERNEWDKWYHHYDFVHWTKKALWFVFTPQEYKAYQEWKEQRAAWDANHNYANGERPYNTLPLDDSIPFILLLCTTYMLSKIYHRAKVTLK